MTLMGTSILFVQDPAPMLGRLTARVVTAYRRLEWMLWNYSLPVLIRALAPIERVQQSTQ